MYFPEMNMQPADMVTTINRLFSETDAVLLIAALRQDEMVWNALQDAAVAAKLTQNEKGKLAEWTPAAIFCTSESLPNPEDLKNLSLGIEAADRTKAIQYYETICRDGQEPSTLEHVGFAALALRERRKLIKSWDNLTEEIIQDNSGSENDVQRRWKSIIAILAGMIPDEEALFGEILGLRGKLGRELVSHAILSNPLTVKERVNLLSSLMINLDLSAQIDWLQSFALRGEVALSQQMAKLIIANTTSGFMNGFLATELSALDLPQVAAKIVRLQQTATLYQLAGKEIEANRYLNTAADTLSYLNTGIKLQQAGLQNVIPSREELASNAATESGEINDASGLQGELLLAAATGTNKAAPKGLTGTFGQTFQKLREAVRLASAGDVRHARELAGPAVEAFIRFISNSRADYSPKFLINWAPEEFIDLLINLNYLKEAALAAEWFLRYQPTNPRLLGMLGDLFSRNSEPERAAKNLSLAVSLAPANTENRRLLANLHETNGKYLDAVEEWKRVVDLSEAPFTEDQINLAKAAYQAGDFKTAYDTCKVVVEKDPFNGIACCYYGEAASALGDMETANEQLQKATLLAPDFTDGWLALSRHQKKNGELQKAYETLRAASFSLPDSSEINLELALLSMETGRPSEALPHLRMAANMQPENLEVASMLTNALLTLGHKDEAVELLNTIRKRWPEEVNLARTHGLLLQEAGNFANAVDALKIPVRKDSSDEQAVINLCLAQLESKLEPLVVEGKSQPNTNLAETAQVISTLLTKKPESIPGHLILGALQFAMGNLDDAFTEFKSAVDLCASNENEHMWVAQGGLGRTALALNRPEVALAVLDEAASKNQKNITLQHMLVPAYMKAGLTQEALITAQHAVDMAPDEVDNLVWYAQTMLDTGNKDEAIKTIRRASDGLNGDAQSLISLAALGLELNEAPVARKALLELSTLPGVSSNDLARAAGIQMILGDYSSSSDNLSQAIKQTNPPDPRWYFELASLQKGMGDSSTAQETVKQAISSDPIAVENWLLQADLFEEQGRHQSAIESLEKALALTTDHHAMDKTVDSEVNPLFSKYRGITFSEIQSRFSQLMYKMGNLTGALVHAEQALENDQFNLNFRLQAARLAEALLLTDRASTLAEIPVDQADSLNVESTAPQEAEAAAELLSIKTSKLLTDQKVDEADALFQQIARLAPEGFSKENIEIQLAGVRGSGFEKAETIDAHLVHQLLNSKKSKRVISLSGVLIAALDAALAVERWDLALKLATQILAEHPLEPAAHLAYARTIVRCGEEYLLRKELGIQKHLPSADVFDKDQQDKFEVEIVAASKQTNSADVSRWQKRGLLIFGGKSAVDKVNPAELTESSDQAAYLQAMRYAGKADEVILTGEKFPESTAVLRQMALAYGEQNPRLGLDLAQHAVETSSHSPIGFAVAAKLADLSSESGLAVDFLNEALQYYPDEPAWRAWLSNLLAGQKDYDNAAFHMEEAISLQPDSSNNWESLGKLYIQTRQNNQAIHAFSKAVELNPQNPDTLLALAASYRAAGDIDESLDCIEKAIELDVKPEKALLLRGEISRDLGNLVDAIDFSKRAIKANPQSQDAFLFLAQTLRIAGKANEAIGTIEQAISTLGSTIELLVEKAKIMHSFRGAREVLPFLQGLASQYPKNDEILSMLAKVQAELGDLQNAEHTAMESLKLQPHQPDLNLFVGKILRKSGQLDKAAHHFSQAVEQSHRDLEAVIELAQTHQDQREYEKALEAFQMAIQIDPRDVRAYIGAAAIYRESKDYTRAEEMLRRAAELDPSNLSIRRQLGAVVALNLVHTSQEANHIA
jgi:tetratricopeptide (TPR) repeat protein